MNICIQLGTRLANKVTMKEIRTALVVLVSFINLKKSYRTNVYLKKSKHLSLNEKSSPFLSRRSFSPHNVRYTPVFFVNILLKYIPVMVIINRGTNIA